MSSWQHTFFTQAQHPFSTVLIDGTGQCNEYGYPLVTVMVINPMTMRGIPIAHMILGRCTEADLTDLLNMLLGIRPDWKPALFIIDKDLTEFAGIQTFLKKNGIKGQVFICFFHTKQALLRWMSASKNGVSEEIRDQVMAGFSQLHFAKTKDEFMAKQAIFRVWVEKVHPALGAYLKENWFSKRFISLWSRCFVEMTGDFVVFTNNYIESWHKLFKYKALGGKHNRRLDDLFDALDKKMHELLYRALYFPNDEKLRTVMMAKLKVVMTREVPLVVDREQGVWQVTVGSKLFDVHLQGFMQDGPHCTCVAADSLLCEHILTVVVWGKYTKAELLAFGFKGDADSRPQHLLFYTMRGLAPLSLDELEPEQEAGEDKVRESPSLAAGDIQLYAKMQMGLEASFESWRKMTAHGRVNFHSALWVYFKRLLSQNHQVQRTRVGLMPARNTGAKLPRTRRPARRKVQAGLRVHPLVLNAYFLDEIARGHRSRGAGDSLPKRHQDIEAGDEVTARRIIETARAGDLLNLSVAQLKTICRGLKLNISGSKQVLVDRIKAHDTPGRVVIT